MKMILPIYIYIENHEDDTTYIEDIKYTKFEGLKLLPPFKGTSYHIEVGPNSDQIILIKHLDISEYSLIFSYQSNIIYGQKTLIKNTKEKGIKKKRMDKKTKSELDIIVYTYKYSFGLCYYYENRTKDKRLKERLNIKNNSNIEFLNQPEGTSEINIILEPGQDYFVELKSKTIFWNGPMGYYENKTYQKGTEEICKIISNIDCISVVGGGDSSSAVINLGYKDKFTHVSTGGGASLELIEGKNLPGINI